MLGIIAWIRPDGRNALVVVSGSDQMASGDPGLQTDGSLKVGDLVFMSRLSEDMTQFQPGLQLVRSDFWPLIVQDIGAMARTETTLAQDRGSNVVSMYGRTKQRVTGQRGAGRHLLLAE